MRQVKFDKSNVERKLEEMFAGCYALFYNGECVYVGQSVNVPHRIGEHIQEGKKLFNDFRIYYCKDRKSLVSDLIRLLKPIYKISQSCYDIDVEKIQSIVLKEALDAFSLSTTRIQCNEESLRKIFNDYGCIVPYKEIMEKYDGYIGDRVGEYDLEIALRYREEIQQEISDYIREHNL